ncbi:hypothetical protein G3142_005473 [Salmonella enterica subsp. enterica serovar Montevideo]|nr:hypothetical protein [Salmonella enterica subsp. enterica serovar Montevideo]EEK7813911.1 hypothetical protein [Salmonella enterica subsp. enterica serovar Montevideo]
MKRNNTLKVLIMSCLLASGAVTAAEKAAPAFTPEQEARIGEVARHTGPGGVTLLRCQCGQYLGYSGVHTGGRPAESDR